MENCPNPKVYILSEVMLERQWLTDINAWKLGHMKQKGDIILHLSFTTDLPELTLARSRIGNLG
jgi:hypothetical protein